MLTNTPFGDWDARERTLRVSPAMFDAYKDMEIRNQDTNELDRFLDRLRPVFGIGEVKLVVDYTIDAGAKS